MVLRRRTCYRLIVMVLIVAVCAFLVMLYEGAVSSHAASPAHILSATSTSPPPTALRSSAQQEPAPVLIKQENREQREEAVSPVLLANPPQRSRFAYTTLISGIDKSFRYKGFLLNALIMRRALQQLGSTADFIAMLGFRDDEHHLYAEDVNLLIRHGIIVHVLPRLLHSDIPLSFAEMALLKVTPYNFTEYEKVQFFDGDVMPTRNMDCYFSLPHNSFTVGAVSPLNSGWFLALPNHDTYEYLVQRALWRLGRDWDKHSGWGRALPAGLQFRGMKKDHRLWDFNGADMDQGLFTDFFVLQRGNALLVDTDKREAKLFRKGLLSQSPQIMLADEALRCCEGVLPTHAFIHYTGRSKPWMSDPQAKKRGRDWHQWMRQLDGLKLSINSSNIMDLNLGSPLGFFNANFPKGGYKA